MSQHHRAKAHDSAFAPAHRQELAGVRAQRVAFLASPLGMAMLRAMPIPAVVLNTDRQIVAANARFREMLGVDDVAALLAQRPGEVLDCVHARERSGGCGTTTACATCGMTLAIQESLASRGRSTRECRILSRAELDGGAFDLRVQATFLTTGGVDLLVFAMMDISSEKRRRVLERVFFHDILNASGGIRGLAQMLVEGALDEPTERDIKRDLHSLSGILIDEITSHREMLAAERGELQTRPVEVVAKDLLREVISLYRGHPTAEGRELALGSCTSGPLRTDVTLLRRILGNLVKNALEASVPGDTVTVSAEHAAGEVRFSVHNRGVIPERVRLQLFQRSFSTKPGDGRGIGTYSVRLLAERYLGGRVAYESDEAAGTTFTVTLPAEALPERGLGAA